MIEAWIWEDNLFPLIAIASSSVEYVLGDGEWEGICLAFRDTDYEDDLWLEYPLHGRELLQLSLAQDIGSSVIFIRVRASTEIESKMNVVFGLMSDFHFSDTAKEAV